MVSDMIDRYQGRPMLRLLDCYFLDALGVLDGASLASMEELSDSLPQALGVRKGTWQQCVEEAMGFPFGGAQHVRKLWESTVARATEEGIDIDAKSFALALADEHAGVGEDGN